MMAFMHRSFFSPPGLSGSGPNRAPGNKTAPGTAAAAGNIRRLGLLLLGSLLGCSLSAAEVVQVDVRPVLTGRAVTTLTDGKLVPWTQGIDGGGRGDGYLTLAAAVANGNTNVAALPDDGWFKATPAHPRIQLHFTNTDGKGAQIYSVAGAGGFSFAVPGARYERMMVFMTSSEGSAQLRFKLVYADGSSAQQELVLPDYYNDAPAGDTNVFCLARNLGKWDANDRLAERDHHNIHGLDLHPDAAKELVSVQVGKTAPGYLVFWGATGVR